MPKITIPKKELNWEEDMQMKSKYIDRKVCVTYHNSFHSLIS